MGILALAFAAPLTGARLKSSKVFGFTLKKQYLNRSKVKFFRNSTAAKRSKYAPLGACPSATSQLSPADNTAS